MPLPKGRVRFYRHNDDGQVEFTGENMIDHTPRDEKVRIYTGNGMDEKTFQEMFSEIDPSAQHAAAPTPTTKKTGT